jgi:hypothetical protein
MTRKYLLGLLALAALTLSGCGITGSCCKQCDKGKACGDSCIAKSSTCHEGEGCACD